MPRRLPTFATLGLAVLTAGCWETETHTETSYTSGPTPREYATSIQTRLASGLRTDGVSEFMVKCPDMEPNAAGAYTCTVSSGGVRFGYEVEFTPETQPDGTERFRIDMVARGVHFAGAIESSLERLVQRETGVAMEADCDRPPVWTSTVGETVPCTLTVPGTGERIPASATVKNDQGGVSLQVGDGS